jgi:hypothetical protein
LRAEETFHSAKAKTGPKSKKGASKQALGTASEVWFGQANCGEMFMASEGNQQFSTSDNLFLKWNNFTYAGQEQANLLARQQIDNTSNAFFRDDSLPVMLDEEAEQFLTEEELTRVLDIKDLFVPESEKWK